MTGGALDRAREGLEDDGPLPLSLFLILALLLRLSLLATKLSVFQLRSLLIPISDFTCMATIRRLA